MLVDSQRTIKQWEDEQSLLEKVDPELLLLAVDHQFLEQGFCGSAGLLEVLRF